MIKPAIVIFFNDWKVHPTGVNAGGGESSTLALAQAFKSIGYRVIACANLPEGDCEKMGIEFWNFGADYRVFEIADRLKDIGAFYCFCATLVHPLLAIRNLPNCLSKIVIIHAPTALSSGLEPATVMQIVDKMVCVSEAQRKIISIQGTEPEKVFVVKNGFDPVRFPYAGPQGRDFKKLLFIGRIEPAKGIDLLVQAYAGLVNTFTGLSLDIFGDESYWPAYISQKKLIEETLPGLKFHGKVSQIELSSYLQKAGLLVFPSVRFESAGLAVIEAQASGCPVVAFDVGGVSEYLKDGVCGRLLTEKTPEALHKTLSEVLSDSAGLRKMSENCEVSGREHTWHQVALQLLNLAGGPHAVRPG